MRTNLLNFVLVAGVGCSSSPALAPDATPTADGPDSGRGAPSIVLGVYSDTFQQLDMTVRAATGRGMAIENQRELWTTTFDEADESYDRTAGVIPMLSWVVALKGSGCATYPDIMNGVYDAQLTTQAHTLASWGQPVVIRFFKEFTDTAIDDCFFNTSRVAGAKETTGPMFVNT